MAVKHQHRQGLSLGHTHWDHIQGFPFFSSPQKRTLMGPRLPCVSFPEDDPNHYVLYRLFIIARFCDPPFPDALETSASVENAKTTRLKIIHRVSNPIQTRFPF